MKKIVLSMFVGLLGTFAFVGCSSKAGNASNTQNAAGAATVGIKALLSPAEFEAKLAATAGALFVDVRTPEEFAAGSLPNASNIDYNAPDFKDQIGKLDKSKPLFVFCQAGGRSGKASTMLNELGFKEVYDMDGGYSSWVATRK